VNPCRRSYRRLRWWTLRRVALRVGAALLGCHASHAPEVSLTMDDGVRIDASLLASGAPPAGGWPA
jgi:hypothetical protein